MPKEFRCVSCGARFDPGPGAHTVACPSCGAGLRLDMDSGETWVEPAAPVSPQESAPLPAEKRAGCAGAALALIGGLAWLAVRWLG